MQLIDERQANVEIIDLSQTNYKQAVALMHKGVSLEEMVEVCEISRGEWDPIASLQNKKTSRQHPNPA
jgi:hypothetical protein